MARRRRAQKLKKMASKAGTHVVEEAKKAHLGREIKQILGNALKVGIATGMGAYGRGEYGFSEGEPKVNSLFKEFPSRRHKTASLGDETGRVMVSRREYVMQVSSPAVPSDFSNVSLAINPGLSGVFAWLSQIASNYGEYELSHLVFHYKPVISKASQAGSMGSVVFACNYNAGAPKFESFKEMVQYEGALEVRICDEAYFGVECDPAKSGNAPIEYIRTGSVPAGQDIKTYDLGLLQIATSDINVASFPADTLLGHLYVEYEVCLGKPRLYSALGKAILQDRYDTTIGISTLNPFGTSRTAALGNNFGCSVLSTGLITFPDNFSGRVMVMFQVDSSAATDLMRPHVLGGNVTAAPIMGGVGWQGTQINATSHNFSISTVDIEERSSGGPPNTVQVVPDTLNNGVLMCLIITRINPDV